MITFCGVQVDVIFDINGPDGKETIKKFENGHYRITEIRTRHPNIVKGVIIGKKGWGLHVKMWKEGIVDGLFTRDEILREFVNILIPEPLLIDFNNQIIKEYQRRIVH